VSKASLAAPAAALFYSPEPMAAGASVVMVEVAVEVAVQVVLVGTAAAEKAAPEALAALQPISTVKVDCPPMVLGGPAVVAAAGWASATVKVSVS